MDGKPGTVTLLPGSLLVEGKVSGSCSLFPSQHLPRSVCCLALVKVLLPVGTAGSRAQVRSSLFLGSDSSEAVRDEADRSAYERSGELRENAQASEEATRARAVVELSFLCPLCSLLTTLCPGGKGTAGSRSPASPLASRRVLLPKSNHGSQVRSRR